MIEETPSVFEHWDTPLEITEYINCKDSPITHLSKYLTFSGLDTNGETAKFTECPHLKIAKGTFKGWVSFTGSGIEKIEELHILQPDHDGWAANFYACHKLEIATGTYPGFVNFTYSGIKKIENLHIQNPDTRKNYASFSKCLNLQTLKGWDISKKIEIEPGKLKEEKERRALLQFHKTNKPEELPFL